ncbi:hypothetical protein E4U56_007040 [Claviceps arundinis]|uniref:Uncharacterized protein n=1 Tax=Claviceps arundinis TaxID=1623583 RepID=A0A9P7SS46_9HYPO|nr:hypothetical protein E4U56_007040 [Claviceps arundinis]
MALPDATLMTQVPPAGGFVDIKTTMMQRPFTRMNDGSIQATSAMIDLQTTAL